MRVPKQSRDKNMGIYGGFGSKAAKKAWRPSAHGTAPEKERVSKRFRGLRLRRQPRRVSFEAEEAQVPASLHFGVIVLGLFVLLAVTMIVTYLSRS